MCDDDDTGCDNNDDDDHAVSAGPPHHLLSPLPHGRPVSPSGASATVSCPTFCVCVSGGNLGRESVCDAPILSQLLFSAPCARRPGSRGTRPTTSSSSEYPPWTTSTPAAPHCTVKVKLLHLLTHFGCNALSSVV